MRGLCHLLLGLLWLLNANQYAVADGKVFGRPEVLAKVEIPNQQALISYHDGKECLVIETAFLGEGTNFAWVVPLPSEPVVRSVDVGFFSALQKAFRPRLVHYVRHYYISVLFVCGLAFLAWQSLKDEAVWLKDLPLCLLLSAGVGLISKSFWLGLVTLVFVVAARLFIRSTVSFTIVVLFGMLWAFWITVFFDAGNLGLITYMGTDASSEGSVPNEVTVLSVQRAGIFESTIIRGANPRAILVWLEQHGFEAPKSIEQVVRDYVNRGWVFVASRATREKGKNGLSALHPLSFTFATPVPVYPLMLTGVDNGECAIDLYIFGDRRANASHFKPVRCDLIADNMPDTAEKRWQSWLRIANSEVLGCVGKASVGTKLSAKVSANEMKEDAVITWRGFSSHGDTVYSQTGAALVGLNFAVTASVLGWLLIGLCRGGWGVDEKFIRRWRGFVILGAIIFGLVVFWLLPKVGIQQVSL